MPLDDLTSRIRSEIIKDNKEEIYTATIQKDLAANSTLTH
jgi:bifunctional DNase/RNase